VAALEEEVGGFQSIKPVMVDKGEAYWKLDGYCNNATIMRQGLFEYIINILSLAF
jgi:hypothetical protein